MDRVFDPLVAAAAADIARHRFADLVVGRFWVFDEECGGLHDLAGLAIAALRDIFLTPGLLNRVIASRPAASETEVMQDRTASLSIITVHEPQSAWPQPNLVPVNPISSRRNQSRGRSGSPSQFCSWPLIFSLIMIVPRSS